MPGQIGALEIAIVLVIVLIIFGPKRLPELGRSIGHGIREFRGSISGDSKEEAKPPAIEKADSKAPAPAAAEKQEQQADGQ